jgi:ATP/maltotriose-dependent transcriptional regulator MalT
MEAQLTVGAAQHFLAHVLVNSPEPRHREEAHLLVRDWVVGGGPAYSFRQGIAHSVLGKVKLAQGALAEAEVHARQACELLAVHRADILYARALLSTVLLARGQALEAREVARLGSRELEELACQGAFAVGVRLTLAEACLSLGEVAEGESALREAVRCVHARARDVPDPLLRERFLREVPAHVRALALARERWGEDYLTGK